MKIIGLEEHFIVPEVIRAWQSLDQSAGSPAADSSEDDTRRRLLDFGPGRIEALDAAGVDIQVLSLTTPGVQNLSAEAAIELARVSNDGVAEAVRANPDRFQGFATLPTPAPEVAARELDRAVRDLGLHGAMVFGRTGDRNFDHQDFWPIFETASALKAPLYMHPQVPARSVVDAYYTGFGETVDWLFARPGIGWHYEAGMQILRMVLAGVFDRFSDLKIITGHWGEVILFYLDRIDLIGRATKLPRTISEYVQQHVYVTPSGLFSQRYLRWAAEVISVDHILMSTDYPYGQVSDGAARGFLEQSQLNQENRYKVASGNWERICASIQR